MHDGGVVRNVATWRVLIDGVDGMTLGFPAIFQFPWIFGFKTFLFSFTLIFAPIVILLAYFCDYSDSAPATSTLFRRRFFSSFSGFDRSVFQGTLFFYSPSDPFS